MIDINELRRLAQAATPGPWFSDARGNIWRRPLSDLYENGGSVAGDKPIAFVFVGWRGEGVTGYPVENNARLIAAANPAAITELLDRLEAVEKERDALRTLVVMRCDLDCPPQFTQGHEFHEFTEPVTAEHCRWFVAEIERLRTDCDALRAKVEAMERQEPVASVWRCDNGHIHGSCEKTLPMGAKLYALPGAKGE